MRARALKFDTLRHTLRVRSRRERDREERERAGREAGREREMPKVRTGKPAVEQCSVCQSSCKWNSTMTVAIREKSSDRVTHNTEREREIERELLADY